MTTEQINTQQHRTGELDGGVALVTGGARGLGAEICRELAVAGMQVICADVLFDLARATCEQLTTDGYTAEALCLDITDAHAVEQAVASLVERFGGLDVLVNNAGVDKTVGIDDMTVDEWDRIMAVNLRAPYV